MCHNDWIPYKKLKILIHFNTQSEQTNNVWTNVTWKLVLKWKDETLILDVTTEFKQVDKNMPKRSKTYKYLAKGPRSTWNKVFLIVSKADKSTVLCSLANTHFSSKCWRDFRYYCNFITITQYHSIHCVSKKTRHQTLAHNFPKC